MKKKQQSGELTLPDFKIYYNATVNKTVWYWHKDSGHKSMDNNSKPRYKASHNNQMIFDKGGKNIQWGLSIGKGQSFQQTMLEKLYIMQKNEGGSLPSTVYKN